MTVRKRARIKPGRWQIQSSTPATRAQGNARARTRLMPRYRVTLRSCCRRAARRCRNAPASGRERAVTDMVEDPLGVVAETSPLAPVLGGEGAGLHCYRTIL